MPTTNQLQHGYTYYIIQTDKTGTIEQIEPYTSKGQRSTELRKLRKLDAMFDKQLFTAERESLL